MLADNSGKSQEATASQLTPFHITPFHIDPPEPGKVKLVNWVCLWIFEELANYCGGVIAVISTTFLGPFNKIWRI